MGQEADRGLKFLHDLDIGYENLHKIFEVSTFSRAVLQLIFQRNPNYRLYSIMYGQTFVHQNQEEGSRVFLDTTLIYVKF